MQDLPFLIWITGDEIEAHPSHPACLQNLPSDCGANTAIKIRPSQEREGDSTEAQYLQYFYSIMPDRAKEYIKQNLSLIHI